MRAFYHIVIELWEAVNHEVTWNGYEDGVAGSMSLKWWIKSFHFSSAM